MPWSSGDAERFKKGLKSMKAKQRWASIANSALKQGKSHGSAIRIANNASKAAIGRRIKKGVYSA